MTSEGTSERQATIARAIAERIGIGPGEQIQSIPSGAETRTTWVRPYQGLRSGAVSRQLQASGGSEGDRASRFRMVEVVGKDGVALPQDGAAVMGQNPAGWGRGGRELRLLPGRRAKSRRGHAPENRYRDSSRLASEISIAV
jgi:hypothetical protein